MSNFGPLLKWYTFEMCHPCQNLRQTGLEATGGPGGPAKPFQCIKIDEKQNLELNTPNIDPPRGSMISVPLLKWVILGTFKSQQV